MTDRAHLRYQHGKRKVDATTASWPQTQQQPLPPNQRFMEILPVFIRALRDRPTLHKAVLEILEKLHDPASNNET